MDFEAAANRVAACLRSGGVVLVDGRSGSGKTTLARTAIHRAGVGQLVSLDSIYPGWDGLSTAARIVPHIITGRSYPRWSWALDTVIATVFLPPGPLLIEGCGAITEEAMALADLGVWVDGDTSLRKRRALERDGEMFAPHWDRWAQAEAEHMRDHRPQDLADAAVALPSPDDVSRFLA